MVFNKLHKMSNFLFDRFLINDIITKLQIPDINKIIEDSRFVDAIKNVKDNLDLAKEGYNLYYRGIKPKKEIRKILNAFNLVMDTIETLNQSDEINEQEFLNYIGLINEKIDKILNNQKKSPEDIEFLVKFLTLIENSLSKKIDQIAQKENKVFKFNIVTNVKNYS